MVIAVPAARPALEARRMVMVLGPDWTRLDCLIRETVKFGNVVPAENTVPVQLAAAIRLQEI